MTIEYAASVIHSFFLSHQLLCLAGAVALVLLLWKKPSVFMKFTLVILTIIVLFYIVTLFNESVITGFGGKQQMIHKSESEMSE
jgi:hypothetical protein